MPKNCKECTIKKFVGIRTLALHGSTPLYECPFINELFVLQDKRMKGCPLAEVPTPHGRLIDADELRKRANNYIFGADNVNVWEIDEAPTIIEAEG